MLFRSILVTGHQERPVQDRWFAPLFWYLVPSSCDRIPYGVLQPLGLTRVCWAGRPCTVFDITVDLVVVTAVIWQYTREDLIMRGWLYWGEGWFTPEEHTEKEVIARE